MIKEELSHVFQRINRTELRKFGITVGVVIVLISAFLFYKDKVSAPYFLASGFILLISGIAIPAILKPLYNIWMGFAVVMGYFMSRLILSMMFYLIFTPVGLVMRIFGKDLLQEKIEPNAESYWIRREKRKFDPGRAEKQY